MRLGYFIIAFLVVFWSTLTFGSTIKYKVDKAFVQKQKDVYKLFRHLFQKNAYNDQVKIANSYDIVANVKKYTNPNVVKEFWKMYQRGMLPQHKVFSIFYEPHQEQAAVLYKLFYYAEDWNTFYQTAVWARDYVNEKMFMYSLIVALLHRPDTQGMMIPPIYEINPYYFVDEYYIEQAYRWKMRMGRTRNPTTHTVYHNYTYSDWKNLEHQSLEYFTNDVALNQYYYYFHMDYPSWLGGEEHGLFKDERGSLYYYVHQQLLARYYLERLSNDQGSIEVFDLDTEFPIHFKPQIQHPNGVEFPDRGHDSYLYHYYQKHSNRNYYSGQFNYSYPYMIDKLQDYERRIRDVIDQRFYYKTDGTKVQLSDTHEDFDVFANLITSNYDSINFQYYGPIETILRKLIGSAPAPVHKYHIVPSVLELYETTLRDPAFYMYQKRMLQYYFDYQNQLPHYRYDQLNYPGVEITEVQVDKLITYFDYHQLDMSNVVTLTDEEYENDYVTVLYKYKHLTHKPFTYKIHVKSDRKTDVLVRVFFGPKFDQFGHEMNINDNRINFFELDKFVAPIIEGDNYIIGNSSEAVGTTYDFTTYKTAYENMLKTLNGQAQFSLDNKEMHNGFPNRLLLPKGKPAGQSYQMFFMVTPYKAPDNKAAYDTVTSAGVGTGTRYLDHDAFGYPFDRYIDETAFFTPNMYFKDVKVYHRKYEEMNKADLSY